VLAFAREGASIGLLARGHDALESARREVQALGGRALALSVDVADSKAVESAAEEIERELGPVDVWVNNAMVSVFSPVKEMRPEEYKRVTEVTYLGVVYGTLAALKGMLPRDRGVIIEVGSALAYRGIPLQSAYCAAKHAIQGFVDSLRCELLHDGSNVRVSMVQLPAINTPQFSWVKSRLPNKPQPVPPIFQPEVAARAILFAARNDRPEMYVGYKTVEAIFVDKVAPRFADQYLARKGYAAQQLEERDQPGRRDNLWAPVPGDHGAHGDFDHRAIAWSPQLWTSMNRLWLGMAGAAVAGFAAGIWMTKRQTSVASHLLPQ
jgi:NAD(P)-dependent dehydrogenase (short-subunit alcohol dehydrogenase family)